MRRCTTKFLFNIWLAALIMCMVIKYKKKNSKSQSISQSYQKSATSDTSNPGQTTVVDLYSPHLFADPLKTVIQILGRKRNGRFIVCGVNNTKAESQTLLLEKHLNWTGLLIEMKSKEGKCFSSQYLLGDATNTSTTTSEKDCLNLMASLSSINNSTVDYFGLDSECSEIEALKAVPLKAMDIKVRKIRQDDTI